MSFWWTTTGGVSVEQKLHNVLKVLYMLDVCPYAPEGIGKLVDSLWVLKMRSELSKQSSDLKNMRR